MLNDAQVVVSGYVATEPTFKKLDNGKSVTKLRVAYTERKRDRSTGEWSDGHTTFVTVQCWRTLADNVAMCIRKGEPVLVRGRLQVREWETTAGEKRRDIEVDATSLGHDLTRGVAHFSRTRRPAGEAAYTSAVGMPGTELADVVAAGEAADSTGELGGVVDEQAVAEFARELSGSPDGEPAMPVPA